MCSTDRIMLKLPGGSITQKGDIGERFALGKMDRRRGPHAPVQSRMYWVIDPGGTTQSIMSERSGLAIVQMDDAGERFAQETPASWGNTRRSSLA
jgi:hypothetical protein